MRYLQATSFNDVSEGGFQRLLSDAKNGIRGRGIVNEILKKITFKKINLSGFEMEWDTIIIDPQRCENFFINIAKGLYGRCGGVLINWDDYLVQIKIEQLVQGRKHEDILKYIQNPWYYCEYWEDVFTYMGNIDQTGSYWSLYVYNNFHALVFFLKK